MDNHTPRQHRVDEVIDVLFKEFGTQPAYVDSPSRRLSVTPSQSRPPPPSLGWNKETSPIRNVEASTMPPPVDTDQNVSTSDVPPPAPV